MSENRIGAHREVVLTVPLDAGELETIRLTLYGVAVRIGFSYEDIEDLKVAVTEACNAALLQAAEAETDATLKLIYRLEPDGLSVELEAFGVSVSFGEEAFTGQAEDKPDAGELGVLDNGRLGLYLMEALVDTVEALPGTTGPASRLRLTKSL